ncbi:MAG: glycoside hydrolase family 38 C-terminal domain-containing protein [Bacteroidota bacterium]
MIRLNTVFLLLVFLFGYKTAYNQANKRFVNGFASKINGNDFQYHSPIPLATESLLVRATDGSSQMEWLTSPLPDNNKDTAIIIWLAGIGSSPGYAAFDVWVNKIIENQCYEIGFDTLRGTVRSLFDKCSGHEWIASDDSTGLGAFIYETLGNRSQMESFKLDNYQRRLPDTVWFEGIQPGELFDAFRFRASTPAAMVPGGLITEYRLSKSFPRIEIVYHLEKKLVTEPEGIYIAFPFDLEGGNLAFDVQGGEIRPGIDQIPGSANDWNTVQTYARIYDNNKQLILSSNDIPLMQFGGINTGRYKADAKPASLYRYSWPMNNYWTTNFNAYQMGTHEWTYTLTTSADASQATAARFGAENKVPFLSRVIPGGGKDQPEDKFSIFSNWPAHVMLVNMKPLDDVGCLLMHVREITGQKVLFEPETLTKTYSIQMVRCDANGNILPEANSLLSPYESAFFKIIVR